MRLGDNFPHRFNVRLSDKQFNYIIHVCDINGITPSEYIRRLLDTIISRDREAESCEQDVK